MIQLDFYLKGFIMKVILPLVYSLLLIFSLTACNDIIESTPQISADDQILKNAYENKISDIQVHGLGSVTKELSDDTSGNKHQRFILKLTSGQTLLISHNIDISTKIDTLFVNDSVEFYGEYVWNSEGGLVHWTHHDPNHKHTDGWLKHKGIKYD